MTQQDGTEERMLKAVELEALEEAEVRITQRKRILSSRGAKALLAVALILAVASQTHYLPKQKQTKLAHLAKYKASGVTQLASTKQSSGKEAVEDPCKDEPQFEAEKLIHNNLGKQGPGTGAEGMIFGGRYKNPEGGSKDVELHINADEAADFKPAWVKNLGFHGSAADKFMSINLKQNTEVTVHMKFTDPGKTDPIELPVLDLSFFDLDKHKNGNDEYVKVKDYASQLTYEGSELLVSESGHWTTFTASKQGTGADNPTNPLNLTEQQLQRAFTVEFEPFTQATITIGNHHTDAKTHGRRFDFIGKPALKCALGVDLSKVKEKGKEVPQCCVLKLDFINFGLMCTDAADASWYHFMCDATE